MPMDLRDWLTFTDRPADEVRRVALKLVDDREYAEAAARRYREALETLLLVAAEAAVHAGINGPMHSGQNSLDALDLIESIARTALTRPEDTDGD